MVDGSMILAIICFIYVIYRIITLIKTAKQTHKTKRFISNVFEVLGDIAVFFILLCYVLKHNGIGWHLSVLAMILCNILKHLTKRE